MPLGNITQDHQWDIDGMMVGTGTNWPAFIKASGMGVPEFRTEVTELPQRHGVNLGGNDYMTGRTVMMEIGTDGDYGSDFLQERRYELQAAMKPRDESFPLRWRYNGEDARRLYVRARRCEYDWDDILRLGIFRAALEFIAEDPLIYDDNETMVTISPGVQTGGLGFPHGFPHGFGSATPAGGSATNLGTYDTYPYGSVHVTGVGITSFELTNDTTGKSFVMDLPMNGGDFLAFDFKAGSVLLGGTAQRTNYIRRPTSVFWTLEPGVNFVKFRAVGVDNGSAYVDFKFRSAYLS